MWHTYLTIYFCRLGQIVGSRNPSACCPSFCFKRDGKQGCKMQTYPTGYTESHRMAEKIFREILPRHSMAVREEQIALCHEVLDTLYNKEISLCEAGVGTGKTLAYLVACILWQMHRPERMKLPSVISTSSVALQDAILTEYLPDLSAVLLGEGIIREPITAVVRKGKERFVCDARLAERASLVQPSRKRQTNSLNIAAHILDIRKKMHDGTYITSLTPFGYKKINRQLFPDEKEAATVKEIFNLFLNGFSTAEIANHLNTNHPKPDVIWRSASVRFILRNEKYIGDSLFQKNYTPDTLPLKSCCNTGQLPKYYVEGTHPGIISKDEFERVQSLLTQKNINSTNSRACILSKVVFCALCGHVCSRKVRKSQTFVWCCRTHLQSAALCPLKPVSETEIQQAFLSVYNKLQANQSYILQPIIDTLLQLRFLQEQANSARQTARDDVQRLAKQRHNLTRIHTLGYIDNAQFLERSIALDQQLREKKKFLSKRTTDNSFERVLFQTRSIQQQLGSSPPLETFDGTIFTKLVNRVQVSPTTIEFKFMNGMTLSEKRSSL